MNSYFGGPSTSQDFNQNPDVHGPTTGTFYGASFISADTSAPQNYYSESSSNNSLGYGNFHNQSVNYNNLHNSTLSYSNCYSESGNYNSFANCFPYHSDGSNNYENVSINYSNYSGEIISNTSPITPIDPPQITADDKANHLINPAENNVLREQPSSEEREPCSRGRKSRNCKCQYCLTENKKIHDCDRCGKSFTKTSSLKAHIRSHTGERPYKCKYCLKDFVRTDALQRHILTHTGEKNYLCDECGMLFARSDHLSKHKKTHKNGDET